MHLNSNHNYSKGDNLKISESSQMSVATRTMKFKKKQFKGKRGLTGKFLPKCNTHCYPSNQHLDQPYINRLPSIILYV